MSDFEVQPGGVLTGNIVVPGDKSVSHRSVMLGALASGTTHVSGLLEGEDVLATIAAMRSMGVSIDGPNDGKLTIHGVGADGLIAPSKPLDMGNSGTAMRLLIGLLVGQNVSATLIGDESLNGRPMERVAKPLRLMGANIETTDGCPPVKVIPTENSLIGVHHDLQIASAQIKSAILLATLGVKGVSSIREPSITRDHSERMLHGFGCDIKCAENLISFTGKQSLTATDIHVPADISSSAFFMVSAAMTPGSSICIKKVGINPTRTGVIDILLLMGANITIENQHEVAGEPVADIRVIGSQLKGITVPEELVSLAIDEFPILCIAAAASVGITSVRGAEELRVKESDRITAMAEGLETLGISVTQVPDGLDINGGQMQGGEVNSFTDHRIAMAFSMAGLISSKNITIKDCRNVDTSFPGFIELANKHGLRIQAVS